MLPDLSAVKVFNNQENIYDQIAKNNARMKKSLKSEFIVK